MTLIMGLTIGDAPALLGDALVTSCGLSNTRFETPTQEDANAFFGPTLSAHVPTLRQKVNILSDKIILAWAGSYQHALSLFKEVSDALNAGCSHEYCLQILKSWPEEAMKELSVIGLVRGPEKTTFLWNGPTRHFDSNIFTTLLGAGSGAQDMASLIRRFENSEFRVDDGAPDITKVAMYAMAFGGQAAGLEYLTQENLIERWGGIVETAVFNGGVATKIGEILHAFWECEKGADNVLKLRIVPTFIKQEYQGELLVTRTISEKEFPRVIVVPPLLSAYSDGDKVKIQSPRLSYNWLCSCFVVREGKRPVDIFSQVQRCIRERPISFVESRSVFPLPYKSSLTGSIKKSYVLEMAAFARERIAPGAKVIVEKVTDQGFSEI